MTDTKTNPSNETTKSGARTGRKASGMMISQELADRVKAWKSRHKETTATLAEKINASPGNLKKAIDGNERLNQEAYQRLLKILATPSE